MRHEQLIKGDVERLRHHYDAMVHSFTCDRPRGSWYLDFDAHAAAFGQVFSSPTIQHLIADVGEAYENSWEYTKTQSIEVLELAYKTAALLRKIDCKERNWYSYSGHRIALNMIEKCPYKGCEAMLWLDQVTVDTWAQVHNSSPDLHTWLGVRTLKSMGLPDREFEELIDRIRDPWI